MASPLEILKKYWGYDSFKERQEEIITAVLAEKNTIALLPTGGGKSICYQVPALIENGVCLVISPLIALMNDQVNTLKNRGVKAVAITSNLSQEEIINSFDNLQFGNYKFLYISPEKLQSELIKIKIKQLNINLIAIDEVHCISEWGHDFRPAYLKIPIAMELHPDTPVIGLTATATSRVLKDISTNLNIPDATIIKESLVRKNLSLKTIESDDNYYYLKNILQNTNSPSIIYATSRKKVKDLSEYLNKNNFKTSYYHGGLSNEEKQLSFTNWMEEKTPIIVATNAFGMGIDKENVECIIHMDLPYSLENYMQEAGRAGRSGSGKAYSYMFTNEHTISLLKNQFEKGNVSIDLAKTVYKNLNRFFNIAYGELPGPYFDFDINEFSSEYNSHILRTYNTLKLLEKEQILHFDENFSKTSTLKFKVSPDEVLTYSKKDRHNMANVILRSYGGVFEHHTKVNEAVLAKKLNITITEIKTLLNQLVNDGLADYNYSKSSSRIQFLVPREDNLTINNISKSIKQQQRIKLEKMNAVIDYAKNTLICRSKLLLTYFDEENSNDCGICDICLSNEVSTVNQNQLSKEIMNLFSSGKQLSSKEIIAHFNLKSSIVLTTLQLLLDANKITITSHNKLEKVAHD